MKKICFIRQCTAILVLSVSSIVSVFAQGAVIGYADGQEWIINNQYTLFPTNVQLIKLTHVIATSMGSYTGGNLWINELPSIWDIPQSGSVWNGNSKNLWLLDLVSRAHAQGVKVGIDLDGENFANATNSTNLNTFVAKIVKFVNDHGLDGVDVNWEYPAPASTNDWGQCINLLNKLKTELPCKRISVALAGYPKAERYFNENNQNPHIPKGIWEAVHAIHLKTYDEGSPWPTHSDITGSKDVINGWASWNSQYALGLDKEKLHVGCAFYGWPQFVGTGNRVSYSTYSGGGFSGNRGDLIADVQTKVNHCYVNGYGGVFIWELGYDANTGTTPTLQNAIWTANNNKGGFNGEMLCPPSITGPKHFCFSGTFSVPPIPNNYTVEWTVTISRDVTYAHGYASEETVIQTYYTPSITLYTSNSMPEYIHLSAKVKDINGTVVNTYTHHATNGPPSPVVGYLNWYVDGYQYGSASYSGYSNTLYMIQGESIIVRWDKYEDKAGNWTNDPFVGYATLTIGNQPFDVTINPSYVIDYSSIEMYVLHYFPSYTNTGYLNIHFQNSCGISSSPFSIPVEVLDYWSASTAYPNPASNILNIEIDAQAIAQAKALQPATTGGKQFKINPTYDVRLYDNQGNLLRNAKTKGGSVQFNVANLLNGIYYLHIYDGVSKKPQMRQIIVEH